MNQVSGWRCEQRAPSVTLPQPVLRVPCAPCQRGCDRGATPSPARSGGTGADGPTAWQATSPAATAEPTAGAAPGALDRTEARPSWTSGTWRPAYAGRAATGAGKGAATMPSGHPGQGDSQAAFGVRHVRGHAAASPLPPLTYAGPGPPPRRPDRTVEPRVDKGATGTRSRQHAPDEAAASGARSGRVAPSPRGPIHVEGSVPAVQIHGPGGRGPTRTDRPQAAEEGGAPTPGTPHPATRKDLGNLDIEHTARSAAGSHDTLHTSPAIQTGAREQPIRPPP